MSKKTQRAEQLNATENKTATETTLVVADSQTNQNAGAEPITVEGTAEDISDQVREKKALSVKDIMDKHARIAKCLEKRESIDEASKTLDSFNLGSDRMKDSLTIKDGRGNTFTTSKTDLIEDVVTLLKQRVETKTAEVEAELVALETA